AGQQIGHRRPFGAGQRRRRRRGGQPRAMQRAFRVDMPIMGGPGDPGQRTGFLGGYLGVPQFGERGGHDVVGGSSHSALSESSSKSACAFPMMSSANLVLVRSASSFALRRRSFSNSTCSADFLGGFDDVTGSGPLVVRVPASRARAHSMIWEEYRPSRRRIAPFSPLGALSYSVTIASLYSGLNTRRDGRGAGSAAGVEGLGWSSDGVDTYTRISDP